MFILLLKQKQYIRTLVVSYAISLLGLLCFYLFSMTVCPSQLGIFDRCTGGPFGLTGALIFLALGAIGLPLIGLTIMLRKAAVSRPYVITSSAYIISIIIFYFFSSRIDDSQSYSDTAYRNVIILITLIIFPGVASLASWLSSPKTKT